MKQRIWLVLAVLVPLLACKEKRDELGKENYRDGFMKGCLEDAKTSTVFPSDSRERVCQCVLDHHIEGKSWDELKNEDADAATDLLKPSLDACRFTPHGKEWAAHVPAPKPLELYSDDVDRTPPEFPSGELDAALELRATGKPMEAEPTLAHLHKQFPLDPEVAYEHYVNLRMINRSDDALDALEAAYNLGWQDYPTLRYLHPPVNEAFSPRYRAVLAKFRDRYNTTPPPVVAPVAFKPRGRPPKDGFPVLIAMHTYGSNISQLFDFTADWAKHGFLTIALPGSMPLGKHRFAYFQTVEPTQDQIQAVLKSELVADLIDRKRVFLFGFGQGATHAFGVAVKHSETYAGVFAISPVRAPEVLGEKTTMETKGHPRLVLIAGENDESRGRAQRYHELAKSANWPSVFLEHPGPMGFPEEYPENGVAIMDYLLGKSDELKGSPKLEPVAVE
ncbi:MAG: hypothetical protein KC766_29230 [Myxococcales bacterium]|nr:hypothetical protein [Myxococcales bacterium]